jgi:hypothetical protein
LTELDEAAAIVCGDFHIHGRRNIERGFLVVGCLVLVLGYSESAKEIAPHFASKDKPVRADTAHRPNILGVDVNRIFATPRRIELVIPLALQIGGHGIFAAARLEKIAAGGE